MKNRKLDLNKVHASLDRIPPGINETLNDLGVPPGILGHRYLAYALTIAGIDPTKLDYMSGLYIEVGEQFGSTGSRVERAMRHAIERAFDTVESEVMEDYFGRVVSRSSGKLTNSDFLAGINLKTRQMVRDWYTANGFDTGEGPEQNTTGGEEGEDLPSDGDSDGSSEE